MGPKRVYKIPTLAELQERAGGAPLLPRREWENYGTYFALEEKVQRIVAACLEKGVWDIHAIPLDDGFLAKCIPKSTVVRRPLKMKMAAIKDYRKFLMKGHDLPQNHADPDHEDDSEDDSDVDTFTLKHLQRRLNFWHEQKGQAQPPPLAKQADFAGEEEEEIDDAEIPKDKDNTKINEKAHEPGDGAEGERGAAPGGVAPGGAAPILVPVGGSAGEAEPGDAAAGGAALNPAPVGGAVVGGAPQQLDGIATQLQALLTMMQGLIPQVPPQVPPPPPQPVVVLPAPLVAQIVDLLQRQVQPAPVPVVHVPVVTVAQVQALLAQFQGQQP